MILNLDRRAVALYRQWARWMLGIDCAPEGASMRFADALYRNCPSPIRFVANALARAVLPVAWGATVRQLYRGLRLESPCLDGHALPYHRAYAELPALSFSELPEVACYFADSGPLGMPVLPISNPATGKIGLPPYGYVAVSTVGADDVLFHWQFVIRAPELFGASTEDLETVLEQREVTVRNHPGIVLQLHALERFGAEYLEVRYGAPPETTAGDGSTS